jgi:dihydroorotate dehydrogenase
MLTALTTLARPLLFTLEPETAHEATLRALEAGLYPRSLGTDDPRLGQTLMGLHFPNPIGIAAGFDKDARVPDAVLGMGCGFAEIGTITPKPQEGNPRPRVFRLIQDRALINRLGFNNQGHEAALARLQRRAERHAGKPSAGIVGVNVGANKDATDRAADYALGVETFTPVASYFTINISSPNTPGLRDLQAPAALDELLGRIMALRAQLVTLGQPQRPIVVKIAPDIAEDDLPAIAERLLAHKVDGAAVSNTTLARSGLGQSAGQRAGQNRFADEAGGLSGRPLFDRATRALAQLYLLTEGRLPLIGIGGIDSGATALAKIEAGASLIQLYTGLVYEGPGLIARIKMELTAAMDRDGARGQHSLTGRKAQEWARRPLA